MDIESENIGVSKFWTMMEERRNAEIAEQVRIRKEEIKQKTAVSDFICT